MFTHRYSIRYAQRAGERQRVLVNRAVTPAKPPVQNASLVKLNAEQTTALLLKRTRSKSQHMREVAKRQLGGCW